MWTHLPTANVKNPEALRLLIISAILITQVSTDLNVSPTSTSSLAFSLSTPHLNITAFGGVSCDGGILTPTRVVVPKGRCSDFPPADAVPNDPIANPILNGYASCCYLWDGQFRSISLQNSDPDAFAGRSLTQFVGQDCDYGDYSTSAGLLDKADTCMRTVIDSGNDGLVSNNEAVLALRVDCIVTNSSSVNASESLGKISPGSTYTGPILGDPHPASINRSSMLGSKKTSTTSPPLPTGCPASVRPSTHSLSEASLRLVTYVTQLDPISATITTTVTLRDKNDMYVPDKLFTVTGPNTPYATIT